MKGKEIQLLNIKNTVYDDHHKSVEDEEKGGVMRVRLLPLGFVELILIPFVSSPLLYVMISRHKISSYFWFQNSRRENYHKNFHYLNFLLTANSLLRRIL